MMKIEGNETYNSSEVGIEIPKQLDNLDLTKLKLQLDDYINQSSCFHHDCDCEHYIYETVMQTFYGENVFDYINKYIS